MFPSLHKSLTNETIPLSQHNMLSFCYVSFDLFSLLPYSVGPVIGCCLDPANQSLHEFLFTFEEAQLVSTCIMKWRLSAGVRTLASLNRFIHRR